MNRWIAILFSAPVIIFTFVAFVIAVVLYLNVCVDEHRAVMLGSGDPPFQKLPPGISVHWFIGESGRGWPRPCRWSYEVNGVEYSRWEKGPLIFDIAVGAGVVAGSALLLGLPLSIAARRIRFRTALARSVCPSCGYDLRASKDKCPECGAAIPINKTPEGM